MKRVIYNCNVCGTETPNLEAIRIGALQIKDVCLSCRANILGAIDSLVYHSSMPTDMKSQMRTELKNHRISLGLLSSAEEKKEKSTTEVIDFSPVILTPRR